MNWKMRIIQIIFTLIIMSACAYISKSIHVGAIAGTIAFFWLALDYKLNEIKEMIKND